MEGIWSVLRYKMDVAFMRCRSGIDPLSCAVYRPSVFKITHSVSHPSPQRPSLMEKNGGIDFSASCAALTPTATCAAATGFFPDSPSLSQQQIFSHFSLHLSFPADTHLYHELWSSLPHIPNSITTYQTIDAIQLWSILVSQSFHPIQNRGTG